MTPLRRNKEAQLAALADGSLPEAQREALLAEVRGSPQLASELDAQRAALGASASLHTLSAPAELHAAVGAMVVDAPVRQPRRRKALRLAPVGALAVAAVAVIAIVLASGGSKPPTVNQASLLALRPATLPSPGENPDQKDSLKQAVDGVSFPYWAHHFGWRANGARTDSYAGHQATTVFYTPVRPRGGSTPRVGYTILSGRALPMPQAHSVVLHGTRYLVLREHGATIVTWRRSGHTCILAARDVPPGALVKLATWA